MCIARSNPSITINKNKIFIIGGDEFLNSSIEYYDIDNDKSTLTDYVLPENLKNGAIGMIDSVNMLICFGNSKKSGILNITDGKF